LSEKNNSDPKRISKVPRKRKQVPTEEELVSRIQKGDRTALSQAITLVESVRPEHSIKASAVMERCLARKSNSLRIGITGVPGVGKSTFIEALGLHLTSIGEKVAVLAIDPTSTQSKGSILGDKTRMNELVKDPNAFIRPSPSGESLGGVARKTRESMILCEAAGFDIILIETVGVGQSETSVHSMVDFFLLLKLAGAGDELQGIKRGIVEMADALVINKADGKNIDAANRAKTEFTRALHLYPPKVSGWIPKVLTSSAYEKTGISEIWEMVSEYFVLAKKTGHFDINRKQQNKSWLLQRIDDGLRQHFYNHPRVKKELEILLQEVQKNTVSPFMAAEKLLKMYENQKK